MDKGQAQQVAAYRAKQVRKDAVDRLQNSVNQLQRSAFELGLYAERLEKAENDAQRSLLLNWAIHYLATCVLTNVRIEMLGHSQAELAVLAASGADE